MRPRRAAAGLVLGAAGMLASRLTGRQEVPSPTEPPATDPAEATHSSHEIERARAELAEALARRTARADNSPQ